MFDDFLSWIESEFCNPIRCVLSLRLDIVIICSKASKLCEFIVLVDILNTFKDMLRSELTIYGIPMCERYEEVPSILLEGWFTAETLSEHFVSAT